MIVLPVASTGHEEDFLVVILNEVNVERMAHGDPAEIRLGEMMRAYGGGHNLVNPTILICYESDSPELRRVLASRDLKQIGKFLSRGFEFRPDKGDHDGPPRRVPNPSDN